MLWLERVSFGLDSASVADYRRLGREGFLDRQLHPHDAPLPAQIAAEIAALDVNHADPAQWLADVNAERASCRWRSTPLHARPGPERTPGGALRAAWDNADTICLSSADRQCALNR
jgi:hypothetical protein